MNSNRVFAGVDFSAGKSGLTVALLTARLDVRSVTRRTPEEAAGDLASCAEITVALGGPLKPWRAEAVSSAPIGQALREGRPPRARAADAELSRRGIPVRRVPALESAAPAWMRSAFRLARDLRARGFTGAKEAPESPRALLEVNPAACAAALLGRLPFGRGTLEGRIQRQLALLREKVDLPDPMDALEELTAHHLLSGRLELNGILRPDEMDALLAAFAAWRASSSPEAVAWLGDDADGWICVPTGNLLEKYFKYTDDTEKTRNSTNTS
jgi:hypothetical protein